MKGKMEMSETKFPYGKPVKLLVDYQGYPDGRLVLFEIWRRKDGKEEKLCEVYGVTKGGKGLGWWNPQLEERKETMPLEKQMTEIVQEEKYYFVAKIDDKEAKSGDIVFTYSLDIYLEDEDGEPLDEIECTITFSDGTKKKDTFRDGHVKFDDAPRGKFTLELEKDYEFVF
jgi:hypothetical protein